jgi:hypothetical protein
MKHTLLSVKEVAQELMSYRVSKILRFDLERIQRIFQTQGLSRIVRPRGARTAAQPPTRTAETPPFGNTGALPTGIITGVPRIL